MGSGCGPALIVHTHNRGIGNVREGLVIDEFANESQTAQLQ